MRKKTFGRMISPVKQAASLVAAVLLIAGCAAPGSSAKTSPSAQASGSSSGSPSPTSSGPASPAPLTGVFALLSTTTSADNYTVSIVGIDGKVVASAQASSPIAVTCADAAAAVVPYPVSTSNDRAYYMDAQGVVRFLTVQGETGRATTVPIGGGRRSTFAVSPDDQRIAVVVSDFTSAGVALKLYVEDLNGGTNHVDIFGSSGATGLWPIGWHGANLVVAKVPACASGGGPFCCGPTELHVVDPATAERRFTVGNATCVITGAPSPAGAVCEDTKASQDVVLDWTGASARTFPVPGPMAAYLSPDGRFVALVSGTGTSVTGTNKTLQMQACGWIDSNHLIAGSDSQVQTRVGDLATGKVVPVAVQGACAGRLPGGL